MSTSLLEHLAAIAALLLASAFFAGSETALFSLTRVQRQLLAARPDRASRRVLEMLEHPQRLIVTIILCNELINIASSSIAATVISQLFVRLSVVLQVLVSTAVMLPLILIVGELTPKSLALRAGERWARLSSSLLQTLAYLITPARVVLQSVAGAVVTLVGGRPLAREDGLREEEFRSLVDVGSEEGELQVAERRLIHNVFEFGDTTVGKVMTPADRVFALPYEMPLGRLVEAVAAQRFSRVPIYRGDWQRGRRQAPKPQKDKSPASMEVVGVLLAKDLVGYAQGLLEGHTIQDLLHPVLFVPRTTKCDQLFREFQRRRTHVALVVDEYGRLFGLVTMEDLLEELFGEIADEKESRAAAAVEHEGDKLS
jgi:CBS domain containing-hemolysin-like protein